MFALQLQPCQASPQNTLVDGHAARSVVGSVLLWKLRENKHPATSALSLKKATTGGNQGILQVQRTPIMQVIPPSSHGPSVIDRSCMNDTPVLDSVRTTLPKQSRQSVAQTTIKLPSSHSSRHDPLSPPLSHSHGLTSFTRCQSNRFRS